ncbi:MAG: EamA-like transporter family protein [Labilithrix sp.]|nr:EamA-like transporter family protein [Labilithrix sp.]
MTTLPPDDSPPLSRRRAHALLHFTVLLWGMTAILGKSISIGALPLVFYRVVVVSLLMALVLVRRRIPFGVPARRAAELAGAGVLVALHWVLFYGAVKEAGVAIAVLCLSSVTFFTAVFEPVFFRRPPRRHELAFGALVVVGVLLILRLGTRATPLGYAMGLGSAVFSAAFGTWNGHLARVERAERMTFYELASAAVVCAIAFPLVGSSVGHFVLPWDVSLRDWTLLAVLAVVCTLLPWLWSLRVLKTLSPYSVAISIALEPVYSIAFAFLIWRNEEGLGARFYGGALLLVALVVVDGILKSTRRPRDT